MLQKNTKIISVSLAQYDLLRVLFHRLEAVAFPIEPICHLPVFLPSLAHFHEANGVHQSFEVQKSEVA